mmetsp:Transcript_68438/g.164320  ORF Transcript_68438/g.164320 Transcript_68438/m.164320 type:complete len:332 (+) Transcript_68438:69-1064(+)
MDLWDAPADDDQAQRLSSVSAELSDAAFGTVHPNELRLQALLGVGAQATVYKAEWTRSFGAGKSSILVAVKRLHSDVSPMYRDREALTLMTDHPNLVKCFDFTLDPPYLVVTEFCAGGSLFDLLYNKPQEVALKQQTKILADIASGMRYLHEQNPCIFHRDLKSSNVLLTRILRSKDQEPVAKVADFGLARAVEADAEASAAPMTAGVGTWRWMAPEVFDFNDDNKYDERADIFSFAMVMYEVLHRKIPYCERFPTVDDAAQCDPRIAMHICLGLRPNTEGAAGDSSVHISKLSELMQSAWATDPAQRPAFKEIEQSITATYAEMQGVSST